MKIKETFFPTKITGKTSCAHLKIVEISALKKLQLSKVERGRLKAERAKRPFLFLVTGGEFGHFKIEIPLKIEG